MIGGLLDGPGRGLVIEGEPGIGKTALWSHGVAEAGLRGYRVRACSPTESEAQLSFVVLRDLLASAFGEVEGELPAPQRRALAIALLLEQPDGRPPEPGAIAAGLLSSVRALGRRGPVLLAVDDVQCLDLASARALGFVFRRIRDDEQVSILLAQRVDAPAAGLGLARLLAAGRLTRLRVGPLGLGALHRAIRAGADVWLPRPVTRRVHELSGGNPLFALELARSVKRGEGRLGAVAALPVPGRLLRLVSSRVLELPETTRLALAAAASLSHPTTGLIDRVVDGGADALDAAIDAGVVAEAEGEIVFTHPLLASAAYLTAGLSRRRQVHRLFASLVTDPEERARHLALAHNPPDAQVADALDRGAVRAIARGAPSAAADLSALASRFTPSTETQSARRRALAEAEYALQAGDPDRARGLLENVVASSPPGPARAQALTHLARYYLSGVDWRRSAEMLWDALGEAGTDPLVRAQCELGLARLLLLLRADMHQVVAHADAATTLAEQVGDPTVLGEALAIRVESGFLLGRPAPAELRQRAVELEPRMDAFTAGMPSLYFAYVDLLADEPHSALAAYDDLCRRAAEHGDENSLAWLLLRAALAEISTGEWARADGRIVQAEEILAQTGQLTNQAQSLATKALLHARLGRVESARDAGRQAVELAQPTGAAVPRWIALEALGFSRRVARPRQRGRDDAGPACRRSTSRLGQRAGGAAVPPRPDRGAAVLRAGPGGDGALVVSRAVRADNRSPIGARRHGPLSGTPGCGRRRRVRRAGCARTRPAAVRATRAAVRAGSHAARAGCDTAAGQATPSGPRGAAHGVGGIRPARRAGVVRAHPRRARSHRRARTIPRQAHTRRASHRGPRRRGQDEPRGGSRPLPQRTHRRGPPVAHLHQTGHPIPRRAGADGCIQARVPGRAASNSQVLSRVS